jgi:hypothetical protein
MCLFVYIHVYMYMYIFIYIHIYIHIYMYKDLLSKIDEGNLPAKEIIKAKEGQTIDFPEGMPC